MDIFKTFYGDEVVSHRHQGSVTPTLGVVSHRHPIKKRRFTKVINQSKSSYKEDQKKSNEEKHSWAEMKNEAASIKKSEQHKRQVSPPELKGVIGNLYAKVKI